MDCHRCKRFMKIDCIIIFEDFDKIFYKCPEKTLCGYRYTEPVKNFLENNKELIKRLDIKIYDLRRNL